MVHLTVSVLVFHFCLLCWAWVSAELYGSIFSQSYGQCLCWTSGQDTLLICLQASTARLTCPAHIMRDARPAISSWTGRRTHDQDTGLGLRGRAKGSLLTLRLHKAKSDSHFDCVWAHVDDLTMTPS